MGSTTSSENSQPQVETFQQSDYNQFNQTEPSNQNQLVFNSSVEGGPIMRIKQQDNQDKPLCAVIVSVCDGSSYDTIFRSVPQKTPDGRVSVFLISNSHLAILMREMGAEISVVDVLRNALSNNDSTQPTAIIKEIVQDINAVEPESVVFNWECCSTCSSCTFGTYDNDVMAMAKFLIDRKHMVMFSDFALKALIKQWQTNKLGPNPFEQVGEFSDSFDLRFKAGVLKECPSAQLVKVGQLCENGEATVHALGGTIVYTVKKGAQDTNAYKLEILSVAIRVGATPIPIDKQCSEHGFTGAAGHVLLKYPSGGVLLTSCGHWIELVKLDVTEASLLKVATEQYGTVYAKEISDKLESLTDRSERYTAMQGYSSKMVQESAPCKYSKF